MMAKPKSKIPVIKGRNFNLPVFEKNLTIKSESLTVDEASRKVSGYLAVFNNRDDDGDILLKGCFAKSIAERGPQSTTNRKIAFCWQHDIKDPIGKITVLKEDDFGLYFEAVLDEGVPNADRALAQLKSGTLNQFSIGYIYVWEHCEWDSERNSLIVKEVNLFEGSVVTMGANELTYFTGMKSSQKKQLREEIAESTEDFIKSLPRHLQYEARQVIAKNISIYEAIGNNSEHPKSKIKAANEEDDETDDPNIQFINNATESLQTGLDLCEQYCTDMDGDDDENEDLTETVEEMKASHCDLMDKMSNHLQNISGKSLGTRKPANPKGKSLKRTEPTNTESTVKQLLSHLQIEKNEI